MLEGKIKKTLVGLAAMAVLACGKGSCDCSSGYDNPPAQGSGYFDEATYVDNADGCRDGCYKEKPEDSCCWCPD